MDIAASQVLLGSGSNLQVLNWQSCLSSVSGGENEAFHNTYLHIRFFSAMEYCPNVLFYIVNVQFF